jgi:hypothetical protein
LTTGTGAPRDSTGEKPEPAQQVLHVGAGALQDSTGEKPEPAQQVLHVGTGAPRDSTGEKPESAQQVLPVGSGAPRDSTGEKPESSQQVLSTEPKAFAITVSKNTETEWSKLKVQQVREACVERDIPMKASAIKKDFVRALVKFEKKR